MSAVNRLNYHRDSYARRLQSNPPIVCEIVYLLGFVYYIYVHSFSTIAAG